MEEKNTLLSSLYTAFILHSKMLPQTFHLILNFLLIAIILLFLEPNKYLEQTLLQILSNI